MVELRGVSLVYPLSRKAESAALRDINARFEAGTISAIIGPSGCGKTSLIKIIAGLIRPGAGTVAVNGKILNGVDKGTAVIFQDYGLLPWKTVFANAELPLRLYRGNRENRHQLNTLKEDTLKVYSLLEEFGLDRFSKQYPHQLSGGMKQRLAIVRALAAGTDLLLMDEPFSSLDSLTREEAQNFLLTVQRERRLTVIMVTHSIDEAVYLADKVYVMRGLNPGSITGSIVISNDSSLSRSHFREGARYQEYCRVVRQAFA